MSRSGHSGAREVVAGAFITAEVEGATDFGVVGARVDPASS